MLGGGCKYIFVFKKKCFFLVDFLGIKIYIIVGVVVRIDW